MPKAKTSKVTSATVRPAKTTKKAAAPKTATKTTRTEEVESSLLPSFRGLPATFSNVRWIKNKKVIIPALVVLALLIITVPHLFVAWVDHKPITIFEYYSTLDQKYGTDTKQQLISEKLVENEAQKRGVSASASEIQDQIKQAEDQASGSANLDLALQQQGLTRADFEKQVRLQILIKKMFDSEASVSPQEVDQYINDNKDQLGDINDQTRVTVQTQLKQQKLISVFQSWLQQALQSNRVIKL